MDILLKRPLKKFRSTSLIPFVLCAAFFIGGCILGTVTSCALDGKDALFRALSDFGAVTDEFAVRLDFLSLLQHYTKYCVAVFLLGFSCLGVFTVPALSAFRGFSLAFSISALIRSWGSRGVFFTLILFGVELIFVLPCFFALSVNSFSAAKKLAGMAFRKSFSEKIYSSGYFKTAVISFAVQILLTFLAYYFLPLFMEAAIL